MVSAWLSDDREDGTKKLLASSALFLFTTVFLMAGCDCSMVHVDENTFPGSLRGEALSSTEARLTWAMPTGISSTNEFSVYRDGAAITSTVNYYHTDSGLDPSSAHAYRVCISGQEDAEDGCTNTVTVTTNPAGNIFYVDPSAGSMTNDGSYDHPWRTLQEVFENNLVEMKNYIDHPAGDGGGAMEVINPGVPVKGGGCHPPQDRVSRNA